MLNRRRKVKAMAPQTTTVELPDTEDQPYRSQVDPGPGGWVFPERWTEEEINDWLITHPSTPPEVETLNIDPELDETSETEWSEAEVISALKADGTYAAAIAVPPELADKITSDNYDPREFFLVHADVWNEMVSATHAEAELGLENKELRKRVNALTRGMRKVNKHWSATKNELKRMTRGRNEDHEKYVQSFRDLFDKHEADRKSAHIFATRLARRLRKARAGRDKRERQLDQANQTLAAQEHIINRQDEYIAHLERLLTGQGFNPSGRVQL